MGPGPKPKVHLQEVYPSKPEFMGGTCVLFYSPCDPGAGRGGTPFPGRYAAGKGLYAAVT